jgi:SPP1 family phage portal protein
VLKPEEIRQLIDEDATSEKKKFAKLGQKYYEGHNDIKECRLFYYNADGELVEDKARSNAKIAHNFHKEISDQVVQYVLSGTESIVKSSMPELQVELDAYFNKNEDFRMELSEVIRDCVAKGFGFMYAYKNEEDRIAFQCAECIGVVEVRAKDADDNTEYVIYWYIDRIEKGQKKIKRIQVWDARQITYYVQSDKGEIELDISAEINPRPHTLYKKKGKKETYFDGFGFIPFFRLDNNKKQISDLMLYKDQVDDYDIHASSLTNNLVDFDTPLHVVKGFQGDNLDELQQNLKTKKMIGVDDEGGVEVHTVEIPYQARLAKLELDEKSIYRQGMALNTSGLKDTNATTNVAIKAAYSLLDLKASNLEERIKQFLRKIIRPVLEEINRLNKTDFMQKDVEIVFEHEIMSNELENAQIKQIEAQEQNVRIATLLNAAPQLDTDTLQKQICEVLNLDYEKIKGKLPKPDEAVDEINKTQSVLDNVPIDESV